MWCGGFREQLETLRATRASILFAVCRHELQVSLARFSYSSYSIANRLEGAFKLITV